MTTAIHEALARQREACKIVREAANIRNVAERQDTIVGAVMVVEMAAVEIRDRLPLMVGAALEIKRGIAARGGKRKVKGRR